MELNNIGMGLGNIALMSDAKSRSISAENFTGEKGMGGKALEGVGASCARELGQGWKVSPAIFLGAKSSFVLAEIDGPGWIQHMWMTCAPELWRSIILRITWEKVKDSM